MFDLSAGQSDLHSSQIGVRNMAKHCITFSFRGEWQNA